MGRPVTRPLESRNWGVRRGGRAAARGWPRASAGARAAEAGCRVLDGCARGGRARRTPREEAQVTP